MKYLTSELYIASFHGQSYNDHQDKFLVGILNRDEKKLKDVITGEIVESFHFVPITGLKWFRNGGNNMAIGYITGRSANKASIRQCILDAMINFILTKDVLEEKEIRLIKRIMNKEIIRNYKKRNAKNKRLIERKKELNKYSINESERNF